MIQNLVYRYMRCLRPSVVLLLFVGLALAQSTIDTSSITNQAGALLTFFQVIGAVVAIVALIFAALAIRGRNVGEGVVSVMCVIAAIFILAKAQSWVTTITGFQIP